MPAASNLLLVSHNAQRFGSPISLMTLARWLREEAGIGFDVWLLRGGELESEFLSITDRVIVGDRTADQWRHRLKQWTRGRRPEQIEFDQYDMILCNSIAAAPSVLRGLDRQSSRTRLISYVRELSYYFDKLLSVENLELLKTRTDLFIANSQLVKGYLTRTHGITEDRIEVVNPFLAEDLPTVSEEAAAGVREELGISRTAKVVGVCGFADLCKGADIFVQLANMARKKYPQDEIHWVWVGQRAKLYSSLCDVDIQALNLADRVHFIGAKENPHPYLASNDVLVVPSREDSFGRVVLEAAVHGIPSICFRGGCGAAEFIEPDCGIVVDYLDIEGMADAVVELLNDKQRRQEMGHAARARVHQGYTVSRLGPRLLEIIGRYS